jgi:hypothetical protein
MSGLIGQVRWLQRRNERCGHCGFPDNGITLEVVEEVVTTVEGASRVKPDDDWLRPCPECGRTPFVEEVVDVGVVSPDVEVVDGGTGGIPQRYPFTGRG